MNNYTVKCIEEFSNAKYESTREIQESKGSQCPTTLESQFFVKNQIVGKSTIPQELKLYINKSDIETISENETYSLKEKSFIIRILHGITSGLFMPIF